MRKNLVIYLRSFVGVSPGLVVTGRDSRSKDHGFESQYRILDGHFPHFIGVKFCLKRPKINEKEAAYGPFFTLEGTPMKERERERERGY